LERGVHERAPRAGKLDAVHQPFGANLANDRMAFAQAFEALAQVVREFANPRQDLVQQR